MKKLFSLLTLIIITSVIASTITAQNKAAKNDPVGKWLFEAPYAPEGYTGGTIEITFSENKYHTSMSFAGTNNNFPGSNVKFQNDTLSFNIFVENQDVAIKLAITEEAKMIGKAIYSEGIVPLSLTREKKKE
jgi:hypothetical protein